MPIQWHADTDVVDPKVQCSNCEAVCCRLTVMVMPEDIVPRNLVACDEHGMEVMAQGEDGWCIALDHKTMSCSIYTQRPSACRRFLMGGAPCLSERAEYLLRYEADAEPE